MLENDGRRVRDLLLMLKAGREVFRFEMEAAQGIYPWVPVCIRKEELDEAALEEAICCVEAVYRDITPKVGSKPDIRLPVSSVRNRLMVMLNFYCARLYGYCKYSSGQECGERAPGCQDTCSLRGWEDGLCSLIREAIRCVEVTGTGTAEPPTVSLSPEGTL